MVTIEQCIKEVEIETLRFFPEAHIVTLEQIPFYLKIRIILSEKLFMEIRCNTRSNRQSYTLVKKGKRMAGFDNLGGWHRHPFENPDNHQKIKTPLLHQIFEYFESGM